MWPTRPSTRRWPSSAERATRYEVEADRAAGDGDRMTIDFVGSVDGVEFEGGKGEDVQLVVGQSSFIPGFVEGMIGAKAGEDRDVNVKFPDDYPEKSLAGKDALFKVKVKEVAKPIKPELNDEFAKTLGAESLAKLREMVGARIASEYANVARTKLKRQVLDAARQDARLHAAGVAGGGRVPGHLGAAGAEPEGRPARRWRTRASRGGAARGLSQDRRAARAPRAS